jgi:hypothetical protein
MSRPIDAAPAPTWRRGRADLQLTAPLPEPAGRRRDRVQRRTPEELDVGEVEHDLVTAGVEDRLEHPVQVRSGERVEVARDRHHGSRSPEPDRDTEADRGLLWHCCAPTGRCLGPDFTSWSICDQTNEFDQL